MDTRRIMVALDGSVMAEAALPVAESLTSRTGSVLILVRAAERSDGLRAAVQYLETAAAAMKDRGFQKVETVPLYGPAAAVILDAVRAYRADVIVMATTGRRGGGRLTSGSVAETVVRGTQTPVFLVRVGEAAGGASAGSRPHASGVASRS